MMDRSIEWVGTPAVIMGETDHLLISEVARCWPQGGRPAINELLAKLDRESVVPDDELPADVACLYSLIEFEQWPGGMTRCAQLVLPHEVDLADKRIAVTSPLGTALLGARQGTEISVTYDDRGERRLVIRSVHQRQRDPLKAAGPGIGNPVIALLRPRLKVLGRGPY